jgi:hypothetical protein
MKIVSSSLIQSFHFFCSLKFGCRVIRNGTQLKKTIDLLQAQVDCSFHLNIVAAGKKERKKKENQRW